jgi:sterol desaturase/sphingolipid hydroxylase (fatty acid hydroxylase superfamily)
MKEILSLPVIRSFFFLFGLLFFFMIERLLPSREDTTSNLPRWGANLALSGINALVVGLIASMILTGSLSFAEQKSLGLFPALNLPPLMKTVLGLVFLDFILYVWHLLNHVIPFLWRFHQVHHSDLDLDVTSASRFHFGEIALAMLVRLQLIFLLGPVIQLFFVFDILVVAAAQFHHSKIKIPSWMEKIVWTLFVPPKMHLIHHSTITEELNSNYGTLFSIWDRLFGTLRTEHRLVKVEIGLEDYRKRENVTFLRLLAMPLHLRRPLQS